MPRSGCSRSLLPTVGHYQALIREAPRLVKASFHSGQFSLRRIGTVNVRTETGRASSWRSSSGSIGQMNRPHDPASRRTERNRRQRPCPPQRQAGRSAESSRPQDASHVQRQVSGLLSSTMLTQPPEATSAVADRPDIVTLVDCRLSRPSRPSVIIPPFTGRSRSGIGFWRPSRRPLGQIHPRQPHQCGS